MRKKDRAELAALAHMLGIAPGGVPVPRDIFESHDWQRKFLTARVMGAPSSVPDWVPQGLWLTSDGGYGALSDVATRLIRGAQAETIWKEIESEYENPNTIATTLPLELVLAFDRWKAISKEGVKAHRTRMLRLKANAIGLATEVERIEARDALDTGEKFDFMRLYSAHEKEIVYHNVSVFHLRYRNLSLKESGFTGKTFGEYIAPEDPEQPLSPLNTSQASRDARDFWSLLNEDKDEDWPGIVPSVSNQLRRLARYFEDQVDAVAVKQPGLKTAEMRFVARHLVKYFETSHGKAIPRIVSSVVSLFFSAGMSPGDVSTMMSQAKSKPAVKGPVKVDT